MGAEAILRAIAEETDRHVEAVLADARRQADDLLVAARRASRERVALAVAAAEPELAAGAAREVNAVRVELLHRRAEASARRLEVVFAEAERRACRLAEHGAARWQAAVRHLAREAILIAGPGSRLRAGTSDLEAVRRAIATLATDVDADLDPSLPRGLVAESVDRGVEVDGTMPVRLARCRALLGERVAGMLEGES
jgi:vacuolar-type H+-ATPase subunit E/Vma4